MTITEALAEIKMIQKKLESKRQMVQGHIQRDDRVRDPLGDSKAELQSLMQGINDLITRHVAIRNAINAANRETMVAVRAGEDAIVMSIHEWLIWRREIAPGHLTFLRNLQSRQRQGYKDLRQFQAANDSSVSLVDNIDPKEIESAIEQDEEILERLDGQLSVANATTQIELPENV